MPTPRHSTTTRRAISDDPSLSPHANHVLTDELRAVIGSASAEVPSARPDRVLTDLVKDFTTTRADRSKA